MSNPLLLTPAVVARVQASPLWPAFKTQLDANLLQLQGPGSYQGSSLPTLADYALGYRVLKTTDPAAAAKYADKCIGIMYSAIRDNIKTDCTWTFVGKTDGTTKTFTLPNADYVGAVNIGQSVLWILPIVRSANPQDVITAGGNAQYNQKYVTVSNSPTALTADYTEGVDWRHNGDLDNSLIDWSLNSGHAPAVGSTYYVAVYSTVNNGAFNPGPHTLSGTTVTFTTAPAAGNAVVAQYMYGTPSADGSTLSYQQTGDGNGGFNNIFIDTGYTSRYLEKFVGLGVDWLDGYVGLTPARKALFLNYCVRWNDYWRDKGYFEWSPGSNYGAGGYVSRAFGAVALQSRDPVNGPRIVAEMIAYRNQYVVPLLTGPSPSYAGGFWAEGWNYGAMSAENVLLAGLAMEGAGIIPSADAERQWAGQVIQHLAMASNGTLPGSTIDSGDSYAYPTPAPVGDLPMLLAALTTDPALAAIENYFLQHGGLNPWLNFIDLLYRDPTAPSTSAATLPLRLYAPGTGLMQARSDWTANAVMVTALAGNAVPADHQDAAPGEIMIRRGVDNLLVNPSAVTGNHDRPNVQSFANNVILDDGGAGAQTYRNAPGYWYGTPGIVTGYEGNATYSYLNTNTAASYSTPDKPGQGGPAKQLTRQVLYVRPDVVFVHDRAATKDKTGAPAPGYLKQLQWNFLAPPPFNGGGMFAAIVGGSKLYGGIFSPVPLTTTSVPMSYNGVNFGRINANNAVPAVSARFITAFQVAAAGATPYPMQSVFSPDGRMEGAACGPVLALFGRDGLQDLTIPVTYPCPATALTHYVADLEPGKAYTVTAGGNSQPAVATPQGMLSFTFTGAAPATVTISKGGTPPVASSTITVTFIISPPNVPPAFPKTTDTVTTPVGSPFTYKMSAGGTPVPKITAAGVLPSGLIFADNQDGSFTVSGTPTTPTPAGGMPVSFTAATGM